MKTTTKRHSWMKGILTGFMALAIMVSSLLAGTVPAQAAACGPIDKELTTTVVTKAEWWHPGSSSITIEQTKGTRSTVKKGKTVTTKTYGTFLVVAKSTDGKSTIKKTVSGKSAKINLKPNKTYKVTIYLSRSTRDTANTLKYGQFTKYPWWHLTKAFKVTSY